jgi:hypothetical protein
MTNDDLPPPPESATGPLATVRYGLGKELRLYPDALTIIEHEEGDEDRFPLASIRRLLLQPGEKIPSKLMLMLELDDGNTIIAAEGMTNVRDFRRFLPILQQYAPNLTLDPPDMDVQLQQAVANRRQANLGCYGIALAAMLFLALLCVGGELLRHAFR